MLERSPIVMQIIKEILNIDELLKNIFNFLNIKSKVIKSNIVILK